jgi:ferritin heavy chain
MRRFANDVKGDALYMMELVLSLEKLNFHKLRLLHDIACKHDDAEMADFIGGAPLLVTGCGNADCTVQMSA